MRTTQLVAHNGALQCNANRLRCPVNEGTRKPRSDARLTSHTFFESHRLEDLEVLERRLAKLAVGLNREGDEVVGTWAYSTLMPGRLISRSGKILTVHWLL